MSDPNLLLGLDSPDDAGVYKLTDDLAIIQTVDFFTPIVDDPYTFGQIAVANALSDVYAMGGKPLTALNIVCFPVGSMDISVLRDVLNGGADKILEAGALLVGGHSVEDSEMKYGLAVTGTVHPDRLVTNGGAQAGDKLILTKPLGTGIISTAVKAGMADEEAASMAVRYMSTLNKTASELMQTAGVHACTDVTGFGLIGHLTEVAQNSGVGIKVNAAAVPLLPKVVEYAGQGLCPGGLFRNKDFYACSVEINDSISRYMQDIIFDPQTSGGLVISLDADKAPKLLQDLQEEFGLTYLFISHDLSVVEYVANRVAVMYVGKLVEIAETEKLYNYPKHPYTEALLSAVPKPDPRLRSQRIILEGDVPNPANPPSGCYFHPRCRYAMDRCSHEIPTLQQVEDDHYVACHLADEIDLQGVANM